MLHIKPEADRAENPCVPVGHVGCVCMSQVPTTHDGRSSYSICERYISHLIGWVKHWQGVGRWHYPFSVPSGNSSLN